MILFFSKPISNKPEIKSDILLLEKIWSKTIVLQHKEELLNIKLENSSSDHDEAKKDLSYWQEEFEWMQAIGFCLIGIGLGMWFIDEKNKPLEKIKQFDKIYNTCQSCGNKFNSLRHYGKNQDGTINLGLCKECYDNGNFIEIELTKETALKRYCTKHKITKGIRKYFVRRFFNKLERWG